MNNQQERKSLLAPVLSGLTAMSLALCVHLGINAQDLQQSNDAKNKANVQLMQENKDIHENMMRLYEENIMVKDEANKLAGLLEQYQSQE